MTLPYSFGTGTTADQNFFKQLQANFAAEIVDRNAAIAAAVAAAVATATPGLAKAWASITCDGAGAPTVITSLNIASAVHNSIGNYTISVTTPFSNANWVPQGIALHNPGNALLTSVFAIAAGSVTLLFIDDAGNEDDPDAIYFVGFGTQ